MSREVLIEGAECEDDATDQSASDNDGERESRNDDWEGYPEYPDPLGGPIGSADEDDD